MEKSVVILGAGLTGLSCGFHLHKEGFKNFLILEREDEAGGLARTETFEGFSFDHSIHILYTKDAYAESLIKELLGGNFRVQARESHCYSSACYTEYPYQTNQHGLPAEVVADNLLSFIAARYEAHQKSDPPLNFEDWLYQNFGRGIAERFMIPYNRKQWAWDLRDMSYEWISERVPMPNLRDVLLGALTKNEKKIGPNREFWYPKYGGIESLAEALLKALPAENLLLGHRVTSLDSHRRELVCSNGKRISYEHLVSTLPIPATVRMLGNGASAVLQADAKKLKSNRVHTVNIGLKGVNLGVDKFMHWVYVPDPDILFHRLSFPGNFSESMVPQECSSIQIEISESSQRLLDREGLIRKSLEGLIQMKILKSSEARTVQEGGRILFAQIKTLDPAYIIYDSEWGANIRRIKAALKPLQIQTVGRFGDWEYMNMDHAILSGKRAAEQFLGAPVS